MSKSLKAHIAVLIVNLLYGANFTIAKGVMPQYIEPLGFVVIRVSIGLLLFLLFHYFFVGEKVERKDMPKFMLCGLFGVAINQMLFFKGLSITSPINGAIIMTTSPILVLIIAAIIIKERITIRKVFGIGLGITGALILVLFSKHLSVREASPLGDLYIFINAISWGLFLVIAKPLMLKYRPLTVIKWAFIWGSCIAIPFGAGEFSQIQWSSFDWHIWLGVGYVVIGTTFLAYLLNTYALEVLSPSVVSFYIYLQPLFTTAISLMLGKDELNWLKILCAMLIFTGVYLVSVAPKNAVITGLPVDAE